MTFNGHQAVLEYDVGQQLMYLGSKQRPDSPCVVVRIDVEDKFLPYEVRQLNDGELWWVAPHELYEEPCEIPL